MPKKQVDLSIKIEKIKPSIQDIENYITEQRKMIKENPKSSLTLNQYLKDNDKKFKDKNVIVVADLSDMEFGKDGKHKIIDFANGDFTGVILRNTSFNGCDLSNVSFCDVDFDNAYFKDTKLQNVDFRGATLEKCRFSENYKNYSLLGKSQELEGIKYSTTASLGRVYADVKAEHFKIEDRKKIIEIKQQELNEAYKSLTVQQTAWYAIGRKTGNEKYDRLDTELKQILEKNIFPPKDLAMHPSFQNIFSSEQSRFDPAYIRGSSKEERDQEVKYVPLTRKDVENYLAARKSNKNLSLNDFAKSKLPQIPDKNIRIVADLSSKIDVSTNNEWRNRVDLSGLDFTDANLSGVVFLGSVLTNCKFENTNISKASFESTELQNAIFTNVNADNANFFNTNIERANIDNSNFTHACMSRSDGTEAVIENSNFDYANIKDGKWNKSKLVESTFNDANLEGISLISADLQKIKMQHAILNNAVITGCKIIESDLSDSLMNKVQASKTEFQNTVLKNIEAKSINLTEAELDELVTLEGADLQNAILKKINAEGVNFAKANLDLVQAQEANLSKAILTDATAKFANFKQAILSEAKAQNINLSYSNFEEVDAQNAKLTNGILRRVEAERANFTGVDFTEADITRSKLKDAILKEVQAGRAILEGVNLENAKLENTNIDQAIIDNETNIAHADVMNIKGNFVQDGQQISLLDLKNEQEKLELENKKDVPNVAQEFFKGVLDVGRMLPPTFRNVKGFKELYDNFKKFQEVSNKLQSNDLLVLIEERKNLQEQQTKYATNLIKGAEPVLKDYQSILSDPENSSFLKDIAVQKAMTLVLNKALTPLLTNLYTPEVQASGAKIPDMLDRVNPEFAKNLFPPIVNLVTAILEGDSKQKIVDIAKNVLAPTENSMNYIVKNAVEILNVDKVKDTIQNELVPFLQDPKNQKEIVKIAQNALDDSIFRKAKKELFTDTVNLAVDVSSLVLASTPQIAENYQEFLNYQEINTTFLTNKNLPEAEKSNLANKQKESIANILKNTEILVNNISPILEKNIPKYLKDNQRNIVDFLNLLQMQDNIRSYGITPEFAKKSVEALSPFMEVVFPLVSNLAKNSLEGENKEKLVNITAEIQEIMNTHPDDQPKKIGKLVDNLIKFKKDNPKIEQALENELPNLLIKHADILGPVVEEFMNQTKMGKKLKIQGEKIVAILGEHTSALGKIAVAYSKSKYSAMVGPVFELLTDKKVLGIMSTSAINLISYRFQKSFVPDKIRNKVIGSEMNEIMAELSEKQPLSPDKKIDLELSLHRKEEQYKESKEKYSSMLSYSLKDKNLEGLSFENTNLKFDNFEIKGFNFDNTKFKNCSFQGAVFKTCSFQRTSFNKKINFENATIDATTLKTLVPVLEKYNKKHQDNPITLDNIKIIGDVSKINFSKVPLNNPEYIKDKVELKKDKLPQAVSIKKKEERRI